MNSKINNIKSNKLKSKLHLVITQIALLVFIIISWELLAYIKVIDTFLFSSPSRIIKTLFIYINSGELGKHLLISVIEVILGMTIGSVLGIIIASMLWLNKRIAKVLDPFIAVLNALPKTALAPIMIIWAGTGVKGIVVVALSILLIITIISAYNYFNNIEEEKIKMMKAFGATNLQILFKLILPSNYINIISIVKINVGMSWIGVIVGEFLVSRAGIGYLIMYGGQIFNLDLVMMGVFVLAILAFSMWKIIDVFEKYFIKKLWTIYYIFKIKTTVIYF